MRLLWEVSYRFDPTVVPIADRHYNRRAHGSPQFAPPGELLVLATPSRDAFWTTVVQRAEFTKHAYPGAWYNSAFRRECETEHPTASELIVEALALSRGKFGAVPFPGMISFIDPKEVEPRMIRGRPTWGHAYFEAGFKHVGYNKNGHWIMQIVEADMPAAIDLEVAA